MNSKLLSKDQKHIVEYVSREYMLAPIQIYSYGNKKPKYLIDCYHVICFFLRVYEDMKLTELCKITDMHHSSIIHMCQKITIKLEDDAFNEKLTAIKQGIYGR